MSQLSYNKGSYKEPHFKVRMVKTVKYYSNII